MTESKLAENTNSMPPINKDHKTNGTTPATNEEPTLAIQRIYSKNISFDAPDALTALQQEWKPTTHFDMGIHPKNISEDLHAVTLSISVTVKNAGSQAFSAEAQQIGLFSLKGFEEEQLDRLLKTFCPNILFPYVRELLSEITVRGGFPPLYLAPANFDAIYEESLKKKKEN